MSLEIDTERVPIRGKDSWLVRQKATAIPFPPFPGLRISDLTVARVLVNQDKPGAVDVLYEPVEEKYVAFMLTQGWATE